MRKRLFRFPWRSDADIERELDDEIRFHLELRSAELQRAGLSADEARREADRQFGDMRDARDYCRKLALNQERARRRSLTVQSMAQDVGYMLGQMRRKPLFAVGTTAILGLAIGISIVCFVYVRAYLLRPLPVPAPDRLVWIIPGPGRDADLPQPRGFNQLPWPEAFSQFETTIAWDFDGFTVVGGERSEFVDGAWVSPGFTRALTTRAALGRLLVESDYREGTQVALISHDLWQRRYNGDPNVLGKTLRAHSADWPKEPVNAIIVGVLPEGLWHFDRFTGILLPLRTSRFPTLAVLRPGDSAAQAAQRLTAWVRNQLPNTDPRWRMTLVSAQDEYVYAIRPALRIAFGACLVLLLVVCVNIAGLLLTQTVERRQELAVRSALGAGRGRIVRQVVTESLVLAIVAAQLGLLVAQLLLTVSRELVEKQLSTAVPGATELDAPALVFTAIVTGVAALIFGAGPALLAARVQLQPAVNAARWSTSSRRGLGLRTVFVAAQLALCLGLLGGAITLAQAAIRLGNVQLGFEPDGVLKSQVLLPQARYPNAESRRQVVQQILNSVGGSGHDVAIAFPHPFRPWLTQPVRRADQLVQEGVPATRVLIGGDYFGVMGIPLLQGRVFDERDRAQTDRVAVVSAALAQRLWPNGSAIGQQLRLGLDSTPALTVAGVVGNIRKTLLEENTPDVYVPFAQNPQGYTALLVRDDTSPMLLTNSVQQAVWRVDRNLPLSGVEMMTHVVAAETARHRFLGALTSAVAAFALILALIGLYGTISYDVSQRSREFAIRAAVGARNGETYRLVLLRGARFITLGITAGALLAALVTRSLSGQIPAVQALGVLPQLALALTVIALGTLALLAPARRATAVDPASLLRE